MNTYETPEEMLKRHHDEQYALGRSIAQGLAVESVTLWAEYVTNSPTSRVKPEGWGNEERDEAVNPKTLAAYQLVERFLTERICNTSEMRGLLVFVYFKGGDAGQYMTQPNSVLTAYGWDTVSFGEASLKRCMKRLASFIMTTRWRFPQAKTVD